MGVVEDKLVRFDIRLDKLEKESANYAERNANIAARVDKLEASFDKCLELLERTLGIVTKQNERLGILSDTLYLHTQRTHNKEAAAIMAWRNALAERVQRLVKWIDGTDLAISERFCALTERVAELEQRPSGAETTPVFAWDGAGHRPRPEKGN